MAKVDIINGSKVKLRRKRLSDARNDYAWQKDPELARLDATTPANLTFEDYLWNYTGELEYPGPGRRSFAVETLDGRHIGNCVYYNIDEARGEAELGIMIGDRDYRDKGYGADTVATLIDHIFRRTKLNRVYLKTLGHNTRAQKCFEKCNLKPCGHLDRDSYHFLLMDIRRQEWEAR